ncbi:MAG: hypothetical protein LBG70_03580 [Bifidobacteriaceae bacterium]|jgi:hypothetical protein|nr:hypothetical protein [Bifidobacteriaceae bacterium]
MTCRSHCDSPPPGFHRFFHNQHDWRTQAAAARHSLAQSTRTAWQHALPKAEAAIEWASPRAKAAWRSGLEAAAPKIEQAVEILGPRLSQAHDKLRDEVLPGLVEAVNQAAQQAAQQAVKAEAQAAREVAEALKKPRQRRHRLRWFLLLAAAGGVGYALWRRRQPTTDPWADDAWEAEAVTFTPTSQTEAAPNGYEALTDLAGDAADAVGQATGTAVRVVSDAAHRAADATHRATEKVGEAAQQAGELFVEAAKKASSALAKTDAQPDEQTETDAANQA